MLQQREVVGNLEDDTDEELLKQVGNAIYAVLDLVLNVFSQTVPQVLEWVYCTLYCTILVSHRNKRSFNAVGSDKEVFWGGRQRDVGGRQGGRLLSLIHI